MKSNELANAVKSWWWLVVTIAGIIIIWGNLPDRVNAVEQKANDLKAWADRTQGYIDAIEQQKAAPRPEVWIEEDARGRLVCSDGEFEWRYDSKQGCE